MNKTRINLLICVSIIAIGFILLGIKSEFKVNNSLEFDKVDVVSTWTYDNEKQVHNYGFDITNIETNIISDELLNSKLKRGSIKDCPNNETKEVTILLDGEKIKDKGDILYLYETKIYLKNINDKSTYLYIEILDIDNKSLKTIIERHYTIESKTLADAINNLYK
ncbi:MAG: hypothetical protein ACRDA3_00655 [Peptostreptococcaceae bacterium]